MTVVAPERQTTSELQRMVDESATFHVLVMPPDPRDCEQLRARGHVVGFETSHALRRLRLSLDVPAGVDLRGENVVGEVVGDATMRWVFVDRDFVAAPARPGTGIPVDRAASQRFVVEDAAFRFTSGDGFRSFGAGRTFPMGTRPGHGRLVACAVCDAVEGAGRFAGRLGNFTMVGDLSEQGAFGGHAMVRFLDLDRALRSDLVPPPRQDGVGCEPGITYLTWVAQKDAADDQINTFSLSSSGQPRGLNIPVRLHRVMTDFAVSDTIRVSGLDIGETAGLEIGFGREARPRTPEMGTALTPFQFEGVSRYSFINCDRQTIGTLTANVLEGRSIAVRLPGAPEAPALRFGYFGPIVTGTGCFEGVDGVLYGTAGSVFAPPPAPHVITNLYIARLHDPDGRWQAKWRHR